MVVSLVSVTINGRMLRGTTDSQIILLDSKCPTNLTRDYFVGRYIE